MNTVQQRIRIEKDGTVRAFSGKVEYGQGLRAAYRRIVAAELAVDPDRVEVVLGDTGLCPWDMGTFGSLSVETDGSELRRAAAVLRRTLVARAAARWRCDPGTLACRAGTVTGPGGAVTTLGELAAEGPVSDPIPETEPGPPGPDGPVASRRPDGLEIVTGQLDFAGDVRLPGMLHGAVLHSAVHGDRLRAVDRSAALALPGVVAVVEDDGITGVVAESRAQALAGLVALRPVWAGPPSPPGEDTAVPLRSRSMK